ncbi:MAG: FAD-binding oxidoreductase [Rhodobacteraceae bacterium]|nr:FAD-binding oxidoreductase [Paracoccaceae bacterium]
MLKTDPFWWEDFAAFDGGPAEQPEACDVVVVGAGLTGCSAALTLARAGQKVLVLDAQRPGYGASTRNGGMIGGGYRLSQAEMIALYGPETASRLLMESHVESLAFAVSRIKDEGIDCDYHQYGRFRGQWNDAEYDATARSLDDLRKLVPINVEMVPKSRQRSEIGSDLYSGGMLLLDHGGVHPGKYLNGMLAAATRAGSQVMGDTPALAVDRAGSDFRVTTPRGTIRAGAVLMATNGYTQPRFAWLKRRIIPVSSYLIATEELPDGMADELFPTGRMCVETRFRHCYFRLSPDCKRVVLGGRAAMGKISTTRSAIILRSLLVEIFPQLKNIALTHSWTGHTGFTFSFVPNIGQSDGIWHALGYSGSGNALAPYLGHKAALQMLGDAGGETGFSKTTLETRFWYRNRPWYLPFAHALYRMKDMQDDRRRGK